jgi:hypothetical protein
MKAGFALDMKSTGFGLVPLAHHATAVYAEPLTDNLYLVLDAVDEPDDLLLPVPPTPPVPDGVTVYQFNGDPDVKMTFRWKSKLFILPYPAAFERVQVQANSYDNTVFRVYVQTLYAGEWTDVLLHEQAITDSLPFSVPMTGDYQRCWWEVIGTDDIQSVQVADDVMELT